jgi:hypothetical protein
MKSITLKTISIELNGQEKPLSYKQELKTIFSAPLDIKSGANVDEMRKSIRILDALDKSSDALKLEDSDFEYLKMRMQQAKFAFIHPAIVQFVEDVTNVGN